MAAKFTSAQWAKIHTLFEAKADDFGLPDKRRKSIVLGSFNIRKLGALNKRSRQSWALLSQIAQRFDLLAIQEVMDDLSGIEHLVSLLGRDYGLVVSDITGATPGRRGNIERLGFIFNWKRVQRTALASDITFDRSDIANNLYSNRSDFSRAWTLNTKRFSEWEAKAVARKAAGKRAPTKPAIELPRFVTFIRQPHCVSFRVPGRNKQAKPYEFLAVNAHLLYGEHKHEREWEFRALLEWLTLRAKQADKLYHPNILLLGDCNLDFDTVPAMRENIDAFLRGLNKSVLRSKRAADANFPLLSEHPEHGVLKTALRQTQTYDQIGLFMRDKRLPRPVNNASAGARVDTYDYGVFNIAELIAHALHGKGIHQISAKHRREIYKKAEFDISDHMPVWMRLPRPV